MLHRKALSAGGWLSVSEEKAKLLLHLLTSLTRSSVWLAQPLASTSADARHAPLSESVSSSFEVQQTVSANVPGSQLKRHMLNGDHEGDIWKEARILVSFIGELPYLTKQLASLKRISTLCVRETGRMF